MLRRKALGVTLKAMADKIEMTSSNLSDIEKGYRSTNDIEKFNKIIEAYMLHDEYDKLLRMLCYEKDNIECTYIQRLEERLLNGKNKEVVV